VTCPHNLAVGRASADGGGQAGGGQAGGGGSSRESVIHRLLQRERVSDASGTCVGCCVVSRDIVRDAA
jgi:hypothetical protein